MKTVKKGYNPGFIRKTSEALMSNLKSMFGPHASNGTSGDIFFFENRPYEGASFNRNLRHWTPSQQGADQDIRMDIDRLRDRSRDLYRNNSIGRGAVRTMVTNVIGRGLKLQSRIDADFLGLTDEQAEEWESNVERKWKQFEKECDATQKNSFSQLQQLGYLTKLTSGDTFVLLPFIEDEFSDFDLKIKLLESDDVDDPFGQVKPNIRNGIELGEFGQPIAYHIRGKEGRFQRVEARGEKTGRRNVLHIFNCERPGQNRGVPFLAPVMETVKQLGDYKKSEVTASVVSSLYTIFIKSSDPNSIQNQFPAHTEPDNVPGNLDSTDFDYTLGPGSIQLLDPNQDVSFANPTRPNNAFEAFINAVLREIGMALEIPFEILSKQFVASYSASRGAKVEFFKTVVAERNNYIQSFNQPIYEEWLKNEILRGRIKAPGFLMDKEVRAAYSGANWIGEAMGQIDETKEVLAAQMRIQSGFSTHSQETSFLTGGDFEKNARKLKRERELLGSVSMPPNSININMGEQNE